MYKLNCIRNNLVIQISIISEQNLKQNWALDPIQVSYTHSRIVTGGTISAAIVEFSNILQKQIDLLFTNILQTEKTNLWMSYI